MLYYQHLEELKEHFSTEELLDAIVEAMDSAELYACVEYIAKMNDIELSEEED